MSSGNGLKFVLVIAMEKEKRTAHVFKKALSSGLVNSLPNIKFLDFSKLKALADDKLNSAEKFSYSVFKRLLFLGL